MSLSGTRPSRSTRAPHVPCPAYHPQASQAAAHARVDAVDAHARVAILERQLTATEEENARLRRVVRGLSDELKADRRAATDDGLARAVEALSKENADLKRRLAVSERRDTAVDLSSPCRTPASVASPMPPPPEAAAAETVASVREEAAPPRQAHVVSPYDEVALFEMYRQNRNLAAYASAARSPQRQRQQPRRPSLDAVSEGQEKSTPRSASAADACFSSAPHAVASPPPLWRRAQPSTTLPTPPPPPPRPAAVGGAVFQPVWDVSMDEADDAATDGHSTAGGRSEAMLAVCPAGNLCVDVTCPLRHHATMFETNAAIPL